MDAVRNPFQPGAGRTPPELVGRDAILETADVALQRVIQGRGARPMLLTGLRGTGKTVLLNAIRRRARDFHHLTAAVEAPEREPLTQLIYSQAYQALRKLSLSEKAKALAHAGMAALRSFAKTFKIQMGDLSVSVEPARGVADSGNLEFDLVDLFEAIGQAAHADGVAWSLFIDELHFARRDELCALIVALHRAAQDDLPILLFGAGLPQLKAQLGDAKSYAERLFTFHTTGPLDGVAAAAAIRRPIEEEDERIDDDAVREIVLRTEGYPFFLQAWGFQAWNAAQASPITVGDVENATAYALRELDEGFFPLRLDRLTKAERAYVLAMARLGEGPYRSGAVAEALGKTPKALSTIRNRIIDKGMVFSPDHGEIAFTVPMFDRYLRRAAD